MKTKTTLLLVTIAMGLVMLGCNVDLDPTYDGTAYKEMLKTRQAPVPTATPTEVPPTPTPEPLEEMSKKIQDLQSQINYLAREIKYLNGRGFHTHDRGGYNYVPLHNHPLR